jgi:hypothetical protein
MIDSAVLSGRMKAPAPRERGAAAAGRHPTIPPVGRLLLPAFRRLAGLDRLVLAPAVVLHGCGHDRGIDDLAAARDIALGLEMLVEQHEQLGDQSSLRQRLAE